MKLLVVARKLDNVAGGVERSVTFLLNAMAERGHTPVLLTWDRADAESFYPQSERVRWEKLDDGDAAVPAGWARRLRRMRRIRRIVRRHRPEVVVAYQQGPFMVTALSLVGTRIPVLAAERNAPTRFDHTRAGRWRSGIFLTFLMARRVIVQFDRYRELYPWYLRRRIVTVSNAIAPARRQPERERRQVILFVGRLSYQKDPGMLVRAFARIRAERPGWVLRLVGQPGEREAEVRRLVEELALEDAVELPGTTREVDAEYARASVLCLPSLWEGFPNAAGEAMAHGVPVVGFADCAGLSDLVRHEREGLLAPEHTPTGLAAELHRLTGDEALRRRMGDAAQRRAAEFEPDRVARAWESQLSAAGVRR